MNDTNSSQTLKGVHERFASLTHDYLHRASVGMESYQNMISGNLVKCWADLAVFFIEGGSHVWLLVLISEAIVTDICRIPETTWNLVDLLYLRDESRIQLRTGTGHTSSGICYALAKMPTAFRYALQYSIFHSSHRANYCQMPNFDVQRLWLIILAEPYVSAYEVYLTGVMARKDFPLCVGAEQESSATAKIRCKG
jgi:hypothetical protein